MNLRGSMCALVTPFRDNMLDLDALKKLVDFQIENGTSGLIPCGTTGESATLSLDEHHEVIEATIKFADGRVPVIAGTGSNNTAEAVFITREAKAMGADAALVVTPYYVRPTQEGLYAHYMAVAEAVDIPIVLYNVPSRTAVSISPETVARLAEHPNIVAIKEATGTTSYFSQLRMHTDLPVLSGSDEVNLSLMQLGAAGAISVVANVVPGLCADLMQAAERNDWERARDIHFRIFRLTEALFQESNPIPVKAALHMMGFISDELRLPLTRISPGAFAILRQELVALELLTTTTGSLYQ